MLVADTDVLIDLLPGVEPQASQVGDDEIEAQQERAVAGLLEALVVLPLDATSADPAAAVRLKLERLGVGIGMADSLIAGIALAQGATLLTRNRRHFERVEGLKLVD